MLSLYAEQLCGTRTQALGNVVEFVCGYLHFAEIEMRKSFVEIFDHALACLVDLLRAIALARTGTEVVLLRLALDNDFDFDVLPKRVACGVAQWLASLLALLHCTVIVRAVGAAGGPVVPVDPPAVFDGADSIVDGDQNVVAVAGI